MLHSVIQNKILLKYGVKNRGVPLTRQAALTTVLHYHADCDTLYIIHGEA